MSDIQTANRGIAASELLSNAVLREALTAIKSEVVVQWKDCPIRDAQGQLLLLQLAKMADKFESILLGYVESGKLSQNKINLDELRDESKMRNKLRRIM